MRRSVVFSVAGAALGLAARAHARRSGGRRGRAHERPGARARHRAGADRAPADLVVGPSDPRSLGGRMDVPRGERPVQPDLRRGAPPRHARRRRRVLLGRLRPPRPRVGRRPSRDGASRRPTSGSRGSSSSRRFPPASWGSSARTGSRTISASRGRSSSCSPPARCSCCGPTARRRRGRWAISARVTRS